MVATVVFVLSCSPRSVFLFTFSPNSLLIGRSVSRKPSHWLIWKPFKKSHARNAISKLNNYEIRKGRTLGVCSSVDNCRLFVGGIPKARKKEEILAEIKKVTENVEDVIVYPSAADKNKNRGFAFVEYTTHR